MVANHASEWLLWDLDTYFLAVWMEKLMPVTASTLPHVALRACNGAVSLSMMSVLKHHTSIKNQPTF
jgi:hypothetical protein